MKKTPILMKSNMFKCKLYHFLTGRPISRKIIRSIIWNCITTDAGLGA